MQFKLAAVVNRADPLFTWWKTDVLNRPVEIEDIGTFERAANDWIVHETVEDTFEALRARMAATGIRTLVWLGKRLGAAGFDLSKPGP